MIGLGRKQPDGGKIVNLRKQKGLKQADLARKANVSERCLRDIERKNHPVPATTITAIATVLQTTPDEITLSTPDGTLDSSLSVLKLTAIWSAKDLSALASDATVLQWKLEADPSPLTEKDMRHLLRIVERLVNSSERDEFDKEPFGEIPRLARLQQLLQQLREQGLGVIAGKYGRHSFQNTADKDRFDTTFTPIPGKPNWSISTSFILCLHFVPAEKQEANIEIAGKSLGRLLREARHLPNDDSERSPVFVGGNPHSFAWFGLYRTRTGAFLKITVGHDGEELLECQIISDTEAKKLTEKYANDSDVLHFENSLQNSNPHSKTSDRQ
jgi:transcriptional regulator with XRE-family HTH domain